MNRESEEYKKEKKRIIAVLEKITGDGDAASWIVERDVGKAGELKEGFPNKIIALVSFDVDKIKDFVFATSKPIEIQGASVMVSELTDEEGIKELLRAKGCDESGVLFAGGGTGLVVVPADKAEDVADAIREKFSQQTRTGSCTVVWRAFAPHELISGPEMPSSFDSSKLPKGIATIKGGSRGKVAFGEIFRLLSDQLREAKDEGVNLPFPPLPGIFHRCESCGMEAATELDRIARDEPPERICETCLKKRERGRKRRKELKGSPLQTAQSINDITGTEERSYFAVLHADANNMGRALLEMETMADYALFSRTVRETMDRVTEDIIRKYNLKGRYQAPVIGGDDILLILPAGKVARVVPELMEGVKARFREAAEHIGGKVGGVLSGIGMSVGFVIVPAHFAIRFATDYAEALLRSAKEERAERKDEDYIDYLVVKDASPLNLSISALRRFHFRRGTLKLTRKPVRLSEFKEMLEDIARLKKAGVAKSQLHQVEALLMTESPKVARLNICYQWLQIDSWKEFCKLRGCGTDVLRCMEDSKVLVGSGPDYETGFIDLLELYEFGEG